MYCGLASRVFVEQAKVDTTLTHVPNECAHVLLLYPPSNNRNNPTARLVFIAVATIRYPSYRHYRSFEEHFASCGLLL